MADQSDVEAALVTLIASALYPNGTGQTSAVTNPVRVVRGWPTPTDLKAGFDQTPPRAMVTVFTRNGVERNVTRYPRQWQTSAAPVHTLTATVSGNTVAIGGTIATPQNVIVQVGPRGGAFAYAVQPTDTLTSIASGIATLIAATYPGTTSSGSTVTVANPGGILNARIASTGTSAKEIARQDKSFQIGVWTPDPLLRDAVCKVVDPALKAVTFLAFPDGSAGFIRYERTITFDTAEAEGSFRRDLFYWVEYPTLLTATDTEIGATLLNSALGMLSPPENAAITTNS